MVYTKNGSLLQSPCLQIKLNKNRWHRGSSPLLCALTKEEERVSPALFSLSAVKEARLHDTRLLALEVDGGDLGDTLEAKLPTKERGARGLELG